MWYSRGMNGNPITAKPDLEGLRNFASKTGRLDPPAFVGRTEILEEFARDLRTRTEEWRDRKDKEARGTLEWLHRGEHGLPVVPVFGGLAWTRKRFKAITPVLSRIDDDRALTLERLPKNDCLKAVHKFLDKFRVIASPQAREEWAQAIASDCMGWPQHLHFSLQGMAWALLKPGVDGNLDRLNEQDLETARQYAEKQRNDYYSDRLASENLKGKRYLTAAAISHIDNFPKGTTLSRMAGFVQEISDEAGGAGTHDDGALPRNMEAEEFAEGMIHAGILHEDGDGYLSVPIPCFHHYLLEKLEQWRRDREAPGEPEVDTDPTPGF